ARSPQRGRSAAPRCRNMRAARSRPGARSRSNRLNRGQTPFSCEKGGRPPKPGTDPKRVNRGPSPCLLPAMTDVLVLGLGPAGARAATEAARRGYRVLAIDRKREAGRPVQCAELVPALIGCEV